MSTPHNPYGRIPTFFQEECARLKLPLPCVTSDVAGFVTAVLALPDPVHPVRMRLYLETNQGSLNYLRCYLQVGAGLSSEESGRVANAVLEGIVQAGIPLSYRNI